MKQIKAVFQKKTPRDAEWEKIEKQEKRFRKERAERKEATWQQMLEEKVPNQLQKTLDFAFCKAFAAVFEKGTGVIERTYKKEETEREYKVRAYSLSLKEDKNSLRAFSKQAKRSGTKNVLLSERTYKKEETEREYKVRAYSLSLKEDKNSLRAFSKQAKRSGTKNVLLSGVEGVGLGILGIGIPDIPLLTAMMLKSVYQISLHYGIEYDTELERYFIMELIRGSFAYGEEYEEIERNIETFLFHETLPENYIRKEQIIKTSAAVSRELVYMKFLQGIPVIGVVGGVFDAVYVRQLVRYANLKYRKRFLYRLKTKGEQMDMSL